MTIGLISALLDLNEEQIEVTVALEMPGAAAAAWSEASVLHEEALAAERTAASLRRRAVHNLTADHGLTQAEAALLLKISPQRVQQLVGSASAAGAPQ
ncbi:hypothetical protein [Cryobacterium aureum]|uniref:hypothetical protein n=1 Tax=Cryobacterium aureum TaxID=995037 RepID=UPI00101AE0CF|nr:hypothetical protein [Cryobacterium aureum]